MAKATIMICWKILILSLATLGTTSARSIEELLADAQLVVEGAVTSTSLIGEEQTLHIRVTSVLLGSSPFATIRVSCNGLRNMRYGPLSSPFPGIFFLRSSASGDFTCLPVSMMGHSALGFLSYPQVSPCREGTLESLSPKSSRDRILLRVAESALCGAPHLWRSILEAASPAKRPVGTDHGFDQRLFKELMKSPRRDLQIEAMIGLIHCGDPAAFDLLAKNIQAYRGDKREWSSILDAIRYSLQDPSTVPQLAKLLTVSDAELRLATVTALQQFHTVAAVALLGKLLETPVIEKELGITISKGLADFANGRPMTTTMSFRSPADYFPNCNGSSTFRSEETTVNSRHNSEIRGDDDRVIAYWTGWWFSNRVRFAATNPLP